MNSIKMAKIWINKIINNNNSNNKKKNNIRVARAKKEMITLKIK